MYVYIKFVSIHVHFLAFTQQKCVPPTARCMFRNVFIYLIVRENWSNFHNLKLVFGNIHPAGDGTHFCRVDAKKCIGIKTNFVYTYIF